MSTKRTPRAEGAVTRGAAKVAKRADLTTSNAQHVVFGVPQLLEAVTQALPAGDRLAWAMTCSLIADHVRAAKARGALQLKTPISAMAASAERAAFGIACGVDAWALLSVAGDYKRYEAATYALDHIAPRVVPTAAQWIARQRAEMGDQAFIQMVKHAAQSGQGYTSLRSGGWARYLSAPEVVIRGVHRSGSSTLNYVMRADYD